jgi:hypothetical protein
MAVATATRVRKAEPTGRQKTQWTGSLRVPEIAVESPRAPARSKLPLVIGALVVLGGGGGAAVYFATRGGGGADVASTPGSGSGSASGSGSGSIAAVSGGSAVATPPPEIKLPELSHISFDSKPQGATVTELPSGKVLGKTPMNYSLPGSKTPRQFAFRLHGYGDTTVELVPDRETIVDVETLAKGAVATVHVVSDAKPGAGTGSAMSGSAASGSAASGSAASGETGAVTRPDTTGQPKPDAAEPAAKPCNDEDPCLKGFGSGQ